MSRWAILLLGAAMMLFVAACGSDDAADDFDELSDDPIEITGDDQGAAAPPEDDDAAIDELPGDDALPDDAIEVDPEAMQPEQPGIHFDLTYDEANEMTAFEIREPGEIPEGIEFQQIIAMASPTASPDEASDEATTVTMMYVKIPDAGGDEMLEGLPVEFTQTSEAAMHDSLPPEAEQETVTIDGREVTRIDLTDPSGSRIVGFLWQDGDIYFSLAAVVTDDLGPADLETMVASVPGS